ncbi:MAG: hypothetical protein CMJ25_26340 [Phycisphaerae bacterium]|jgi:RHS repeat-associated protein|nr:hypothetical protein [Phycisphaerae bacterium]
MILEQAKSRSWLSIMCFLTAFSALAYAGFPVNSAGGKCGIEAEESQAGTELGDGGKDNSDPIYLATGDYQRSETDLFIPGRGLDFEFKRMYRSRSSLFAEMTIPTQYNSTLQTEIGQENISNRSPLGIGWQHKYNMRIDLDEYAGVVVVPPATPGPGPDPEPIIAEDNEPTDIFLYDGTGRWDRFSVYTTHDAVASNPAWYSNEKFAVQFQYSVHDAYIEMYDANQIRYQFLPFYTPHDPNAILPYAGRLHSITDRNGNQLNFSYETSNGVERLASMTDTLGHLINFYYHDNSGSPIHQVHPEDHVAHLLWQVQDHAGRIVEFEYENISGDYEARLISTTLPSIKNTTNFPLQYTSAEISIDHGRFASGRKWQYEYATALSSGWLRDGMMTKVTDPNGVVVIQNEYDPRTTLDRRAYGRVIRQQYGDEAYNYVWVDVFGNLQAPSSGNDYYVWVNDRRGAITRFKYSQSYGLGDQRDLQLLEKTEYLGFVDDPDDRVFIDTRNGGSQWSKIDTDGVVSNLTGSLPHSPITTAFTPDSKWNVAGIALANGSSTGWAYENYDVDLGDADFNPSLYDPRKNRSLIKRTHKSPVGHVPAILITEEWRYDFDFGGAGGGCGCGSSGFETAYKDGEGNVTRKTYDTNGNLLKVFRGLRSSYFTEELDESAAASAAASLDVYTYNQWGQVETHTHPEKTIINSQGGEEDHSRVDKYEYYNNPSDAANHGRLHKMRIDYDGLDLTTTYEYDLIGNVIKETGPGGDVTEYLYNQMSELVRLQQFDNASNLFTESMFFYDANGNMVVEEELNLDGDQNPVADSAQNNTTSWFTTVHLYDKLNYRIESSREKSPVNGIYSNYETTVNPDTGYAPLHATSEVMNSDYITQRWTFDENRNLTKFENGEAVIGGQASNIVTHEYDARDLRIQTIRGAGGTSPLKTVFEYNDDGLLESMTVNPDTPLESRTTNYVYDGINRVESVSDPMANMFVYTYDDNHNITSAKACGPIDEDTTGSDTLYALAKITRTYDTLDRYDSQSYEVYDYAALGTDCADPSNSTQQVVSIVYNDDSSIQEMSVPSGDDQLSNITQYFYDSASRRNFIVDGAGNITESEYDSDSNLTKVIQSDFSSESPTTSQVFHVDYAYDALDRQISMTDGVGNDTLYEYDSRSNMVEMTDARNNVTSYVYDALGRNTQVNSPLSITVSSTYDNSQRLVSETDDNGNTTQYAYDGLNRIISVTMPDNTSYSVAYDANGNPATYTDARGVEVAQVFDKNNRLIGRTIDDSNATASIPGTTSEDFTYDGLGRLRTALNDFAKVTREYDSRSNVTREITNTDTASDFTNTSFDRVVEYVFDQANNNIQITYPSGREIYRTYDELNRLAGIFSELNTDPVTEFGYIGRRVESRSNGNGTRTGYNYNGYSGALVESSDKGFGRMNKITTSKVSTSTILDAFTFTWDETQNRTSYKDTSSGLDNRRERTFDYDELNRLVSTDVDFPDPNTDFLSPTNNGVTSYTLDGVHNRTEVSGFDAVGAPIGDYELNGVQADNNQYSKTPRIAGGEWDYIYDANGNMVLRVQSSPADYNGDYTHNFYDLSAFMSAYNNGDSEADYNGDGQVNYSDVSAFTAAYGPLDGTDLEHWHYSYDFRNQLIEVTHGTGNVTPVGMTNTYDALARRVLEDTNGSTRQLVYGGVSHWEVLEQIDLSQTPEVVLTTHVYGLGIDDEVSYRIEDLATHEDMWSHRDDLNSLTSITDDVGDVKERYEYGDYGKATIFDASGNTLTASSFSAQLFYTGRLQIGGSGLYDLRFRVLEPETGRFGQRDPLGYVDTMNIYLYARSNSIRYTDPYGLIPPDDVMGPRILFGPDGDSDRRPDIRFVMPGDNFWVLGIHVDDNQDIIDRLKKSPASGNKVCRISGHCGVPGIVNLPGEKTGSGNPNVDAITPDNLENLINDPLDGTMGPPTPKQCREAESRKRLRDILDALDANCDTVIFEQCKPGRGPRGERLQDALDTLYPNTRWVLPKGTYNDNPFIPYDTGGDGWFK